MRVWMTWLSGFLILSAASVAALSLSQGQERPPARQEQVATSPTIIPAVAKLVEERPTRDLSKLPLLQQQMYLSARRGAEWLVRWNRPDGRFVYGCLPALQKALEGDHYLRQVGAAFALARAARLTGEERYAAIARQALLTLLLETALDPQSPGVRSTALPSVAVNRLATAGLLVLAIHELPTPGADLLEQSEQLCAFIRRQQRADGSLNYGDSPDDTGAETEDPEGINYYPGEALYGLMRSQVHQPATWKTDVVRKALSYYRPWWRSHKNMALVPWQTAAYTEAYMRTKDSAFAEAVYEMNDWIVDLQYVLFDPRHPLWLGGFMAWADGKAVAAPPQISSAVYAEGLGEACRVARQTGDLSRYQRYREALERCLQFLATLQYTEANTRHFADWYKPTLLGAFYASHQDGNLRIDYTQHALCAMAQYLTYASDGPAESR
jgi:hypothetical protein